MYKAALAEAPNYAPEGRPYPPLRLVPGVVEEPTVTFVSEGEYEPETLRTFEQWLGSLGLVDTVAEERSDNTNLLERLQQALNGSAEASKWLDINILTAAGEAYFKDRHITSVYMERDGSGELRQFGQSDDSIQRNAILMRPGRPEYAQAITEAEALNKFRISHALKTGRLKHENFVVASIVPEEGSEEELGPEGEGYFLDSMTFVVQGTSELDDGRIKTESAFLAGVESEEGDKFKDLVEKRYDIAVLTKVYERLGKTAPKTALGFLKNGLYIPKSIMPNGVVDFVRWCDVARDELEGHQVERKFEDYLRMELESKRRMASLKDVCQKVRENLLASVKQFQEPMDAVKFMWWLIKKHGTKEATTNYNIDPGVFGRAAAPEIIMARHDIENGNLQQAKYHTQEAEKKAETTGCGGGSSRRRGRGGRWLTGESDEEDALQGGEEEDERGSLEFECTKGHKNKRKKNAPLETKCCVAGCDGQVCAPQVDIIKR